MVPFFFFLMFFLFPLVWKEPADPFRGDAPGHSSERGEDKKGRWESALSYTTRKTLKITILLPLTAIIGGGGHLGAQGIKGRALCHTLRVGLPSRSQRPHHALSPSLNSPPHNLVSLPCRDSQGVPVGHLRLGPASLGRIQSSSGDDVEGALKDACSHCSCADKDGPAYLGMWTKNPGK